MIKHLTLNRIFALYVVFFAAVIAGILPREAVVYATAALMLWMALTPLEDATLFFVRSVPLFVAIPLTAAYDNLNMWRPLALLLLVRLLLQRQTWHELGIQWRTFRKSATSWLKQHPTFRRLTILLILAVLSLIGAKYPAVGIKRIIYFANLLMVPTVLWTLIRRGKLTALQVIKSLAIPTMLVIVVGYIQLASTYLIDIYQFMRLWGEQIQLRQFGEQWSSIAVTVGNTWLAYYGPQLSLRVFSLFTDSHTFPMYVLMGLPAIAAWAKGRSRWAYAWIPAALLIIILSGTRGIWAAAIPIALATTFLAWKQKPFRPWARYLGLFFLLFAVAWPIFISPQFLLGKGIDLRSRIKSIVDFGETSNAQRILIWKASLKSIAANPLLGVGIGNFPVVLDQNIQLARAGSTAHNVYLHVAAEMGIPAAVEFMILLGSIVFAAWRWFQKSSGQAMIYSAGALIFIPWVFIYLLTDAALFDERAFLMFSITAALILAHE
jgi:O-antigen ligase